MKFKDKFFKIALALVVSVFLAVTLPKAFKPPVGGRNAERQGYTAGIIRIYCEDPGQFFIKGPQIHFGRNPFNLELTAFEWLQGGLARVIDGPECDSVEPVAKTISILFSALGLIAVALVASQLGSGLAGLIAALVLAGDELWLRYSTYTMIENRVLCLALFAVYFSLKRRGKWSVVFWAAAFLQKPQIFLFMSALWIGIELVRSRKLPPRKILGAYAAAALVGFIWYGWCNHLDRQSDLPWIVHTGKWAKNWYVGNLGERLSWVYWKNLALDWLRRSGLVFVVPALLILLGGRSRFKAARDVIVLASPLLAATLIYTFTFYAVFVTHEYYAIPLNVGLSLVLAQVLDFLLRQRPAAGWRKKLPALIAVIAIARSVFVGGYAYGRFVVESVKPESFYYHHDWARNVFPEKHSFVAMAVDGTGRDLLYLYLAKQRGLLWCASNPEFAPRAYWKEQGVKYVAWSQGVDPSTHHQKWLVRTLEEELVLARTKGWSSDIHDVWAGKSMAEWAALASRKELNPCTKWPDPRKWEREPDPN